MAQKTKKRKRDTSFLPIEKAHTESQLDVIGYFDAGYKRKHAEPGTAKTVRLTDTFSVQISANAKFGYPNGLDLDYWRSFQIICSQRLEWHRKFRDGKETTEPHLKMPVPVPAKAFIKLAGRQPNQREYGNIIDFFDRHTLTGITGIRLKRDIEDVGDEFDGYMHATAPLFKRIVARGSKLPDGTLAPHIHVWINDWYLSNFCRGLRKQTNVLLHHSLHESYGRALYPIMDRNFITSEGYMNKDYSAVCETLSITRQKHLSRIKQQLGPSLDEFVELEVITSWDITKNARGDGFNIKCRAGDFWRHDHGFKTINPCYKPHLKVCFAHDVNQLELLPQQEPSPNNTYVKTDTPTEQGSVQTEKPQERLPREFREWVYGGNDNEQAQHFIDCLCSVLRDDPKQMRKAHQQLYYRVFNSVLGGKDHYRTMDLIYKTAKDANDENQRPSLKGRRGQKFFHVFKEEVWLHAGLPPFWRSPSENPTPQDAL